MYVLSYTLTNLWGYDYLTPWVSIFPFENAYDVFALLSPKFGVYDACNIFWHLNQTMNVSPRIGCKT